LFEKASFEIELQDEDIVLLAEYQPPHPEGSDTFFGDHFAAVGLRTVVSSFVGNTADGSLNPIEARSTLLAMAG